MKKHNKFIYDSYKITQNSFSFKFLMDEYEFEPVWKFELPIAINSESAVLKELVFNLGMVELISYWKSACPTEVEINCGALSDWQKKWWKKLYLNGLGEFFYKNNIVPEKDFMNITASGAPNGAELSNLSNLENKPALSGALIPVGGGKDSVVTLETLSGEADNACYIVGNIGRAYDCAKTAGYGDDKIIKVSRSIDKTLLELNRLGYLNGHTPFSAIIAFSSLIFAYLTNKRYIILSNESSANEGNVSGSEVNHQYSKSIEFEKDFREYISFIEDRFVAYSEKSPMGKSITKQACLPEYFSLLRSFNELQIAEKFSKYPKYFPVFQSCNAGVKSNVWCNNCAKCLYVYIMLAAFLEDEALIGIFGEDLLEKNELYEILVALLNANYDKPFECVGTREELNAALYLALKRRGNRSELALIKKYLEAGNKINSSEKEIGELTLVFDEKNFIPKEFLRLVK